MTQGREEAMERGRLAAFCVTALAIQAYATLVTVFLPEFYANALALPVGAVGTAFMTVRVLDLMIDPLLGGMMDATRSRWGRYRPWLVASAPILMLSTYALFQAERGVGMAYLWAWLFIAFIGFSMIVLSHLAWTATLATGAAERTRIFAWWQIFATAGQFSILAILPLVASAYPGDPGAGMHAAGWVMIVLIPAAILLALKTTPEKQPSEGSQAALALRDYVALFSQGPVVRLVLADLLIALSTGVANAVALFFYMGQLGFDRAAASTLILIAYAAAFAGTPLFAKLAGRIGKARALQVGALMQAALQLLMATQPANAFWLTAANVAVLGLCIPIAWFLPRALMADVADATRARFGVDRTGLLYATLNGSMKLALGLAVGLAFLLLGWLGFDPAHASDPRNALPLRTLIGIVPALFSLGVVLCMMRYPETSLREASRKAALA
ncbi:MFS transporter [Sphingomonadales bacterium 56]|uniref:MFS transporter n=1 Tax=unclassified Sphingobium TaxID=2611147 RepID=UPI00191B7F1A|nr:MULTISPECIES: MFS transporter [unclassified Sphingobium]MBY2930309.1 MFS transporter [Sphingomonadales bacterium 56]MBY2960353.1 MFS transporter [Sphingomonadales bacterium 58]CAD7340938.1 Putative glycoside/cation symporter YagG [Sphingobium sp. S8]CAD7341084.1 Putative glycoside/cation symporter YagG [Sphingobium sp. S6]